MLTDLYIKDLVLIHDLSLNFEQGFSVFTGETGAGKSILLDALSLSLGKRGDTSLIRKGADQSTVSSFFEISQKHEILPFLEELSLLCIENPNQIHLKRVLSEKGSKAFINDIPVNLQTLKRVGDSLLEIHGQFDNLFDEASHFKYLDAYIEDQKFHEILKSYREIFKEKQILQKQYESLLKDEQNQQDVAIIKKNIIDELLPLDLYENEEEILLKERGSIESFGKISSVLEKCRSLLNDGSFIKDLSFCISQLDRTKADFINPILDPLKKIESECLEAKDQVEDLFKNTKDSLMRLTEIDERLYTLRQKAKKYHVTTDDLLPLLNDAKKFFQRDFDAEKFDLLKKLESVRTLSNDHMQKLSIYRKEFALKLEGDINHELQFLKLPNARFKVSLRQLDEKMATLNGQDLVEFLISANKQQDFTNLSKSASGGELARIMLALKTVLSQKTSLCSIVFDEIETGVSGSVASAIGERMRALSKKIQVLSITHSPQIAGQSDVHYLVQKLDEETQTKTHVALLRREQKILEVARMISGESLTESSINAAKELLAF